MTVLIALEAAAALAAGTGPGPRTIPGARPRVVSRESCVKQAVLGGSRCRCASLDALRMGDARDVNDALRVGDAWDVNDALRVGDAWDVNDVLRVGDAWALLMMGTHCWCAPGSPMLRTQTRLSEPGPPNPHVNPLIGAWARLPTYGTAGLRADKRFSAPDSGFPCVSESSRCRCAGLAPRRENQLFHG